MNKGLLWYGLGAFAIALFFAPFIIAGLRRLRAGQEILKYVDWHKGKSGTPTMGGLVFILPIVVLSVVIIDKATPLCMIAVLASLGYGVLGFLDDFLKIRHKENLGLRAYQKIIGQGGIAVIVAVFYYMANPDGRVFVPFFNTTWDIGFWIAPFTFLVLVATTNAVNLTDGIDGLAGSVSLCYFAVIGVLIAVLGGMSVVVEGGAFLQIIAVTVGGLMCWLLFNSNKAKVFMGDTGSLYLGGLVACVSVFTGLGLVILVLGAVFVWSAVSVILQVIYFKITHGKRIFLMSPFHHHLEKRGWGEARIVTLYCVITILVGMLLLGSILP